MFDAQEILDGLIRGALSSRGKRWTHTHRALGAGSLVNASTLLAAAGVAWGLYETWQQQQPVGTPGPAPAPAPAGTDAPSAVAPGTPASPNAVGAASEGSLPLPLLQLMRVMVSAARADGEIGPAERERILAEAREVGAEAEVQRELLAPRPVAEVVAGVSDPQLKEQLYALAFTIVRADEQVTGGERIYLARLAGALGLDPASSARLEGEVASRIQAAAARPQQ